MFLFVFVFVFYFLHIVNNNVLHTSYFYIFLLVFVFVFWHSSIPVLLDISFFGINLKEKTTKLVFTLNIEIKKWENIFCKVFKFKLCIRSIFHMEIKLYVCFMAAFNLLLICEKKLKCNF